MGAFLANPKLADWLERERWMATCISEASLARWELVHAIMCMPAKHA